MLPFINLQCGMIKKFKYLESFVELISEDFETACKNNYFTPRTANKFVTMGNKGRWQQSKKNEHESNSNNKWITGR